jgi:hypothetical protein
MGTTQSAPNTQNTYTSRPGAYSSMITWDWFNINTDKNMYAGRGNMTVEQRITYLNHIRTGRKDRDFGNAKGLEGPQNKISQSGAPYSSENSNTRKIDLTGNYNT